MVARDAALPADGLGDDRERVGVVVAPDAQVLGGDSTPRFEGSGFGHHRARTTDRTASEMVKVRVRREAVTVVTGVPTHRRYHHAIRTGRFRESQRREEVVRQHRSDASLSKTPGAHGETGRFRRPRP